MPEASEPISGIIESAGAGLTALLVEAQATWLARAQASGGSAAGPGFRPFEDAFPTFYQFTNKPR